ncbi:MAG: hypothetical protein NT025_10130 [bacterium]|nr:hypothetical protein [bacterium]
MKKLKLPESTYYRWQRQGSLSDQPSAPRRVWNRLLDDEVTTVVANAMLYTDLSPRELAFRITDCGGCRVPKAKRYRS